MGILESAFLGVLQGLTEFLPLSSSGHLVLAQSFIPGFTQPGVLFDVILHTGTLLAILIYFRKSFLSLSKNYVWYLFLASIPVALIGYFFSDTIERLFVSTTLVGFALILTGILNFFTDSFQKGKNDFNHAKALFVGLFQALAILPGVSRSGATIFAGTKAGISRKEAAKFSFLLSVPAVMGGSALQLFKYGASVNGELQTYFVGSLSAAVFGYLSIGVVLKFLEEKRFKVFALYCITLGIAALFL